GRRAPPPPPPPLRGAAPPPQRERGDGIGQSGTDPSITGEKGERRDGEQKHESRDDHAIPTSPSAAGRPHGLIVTAFGRRTTPTRPACATSHPVGYNTEGTRRPLAEANRVEPCRPARRWVTPG